MAIKKVGDLTAELQPGYPKYSFSFEEKKVQLLYKGSYESCVAKRPEIGSILSAYGGLEVVSAEVYTAPGGAGYLLVEANDQVARTNGSGGNQKVKEVEWVVSEIDLRLHPRYQSGGDAALTTEDLVHLQLWESEPDVTLKIAFKTKNPASGATISLSANATELAKKWLRGFTHYVQPSPVARMTSLKFGVPTTTQVGKRRASKPFTQAPGGYEWLGTADRATRTGGQGRWRREEEWTGADVWDPDIYPVGS